MHDGIETITKKFFQGKDWDDDIYYYHRLQMKAMIHYRSKGPVFRSRKKSFSNRIKNRIEKIDDGFVKYDRHIAILKNGN